LSPDQTADLQLITSELATSSLNARRRGRASSRFGGNSGNVICEARDRRFASTIHSPGRRSYGK